MPIAVSLILPERGAVKSMLLIEFLQVAIFFRFFTAKRFNPFAGGKHNATTGMF